MLSVETSLSDDLLCLPSALMSTIIYDYVSFLVGLHIKDVKQPIRASIN